MKHLSILLTLVLLGCSHSEFDVSTDQVAKHKPSGLPDLKHLPPGAVKHEMTFKKGDRLPDGTISDGNRKMITIQVPPGDKSPNGGKRSGQIRLMTADSYGSK
jgi:hypothetical protein